MFGKKRNKTNKSFIKRLIILAGLLIVGLFFPKFAALNPELVEKLFTQGLYTWISTLLGAVTSLVRISVTEYVLLALVIAVIVLTILFIVQLFKRRVRLSGVLSGILSIALTLAILLNMFNFMWGLNYHRPALYTLMDMDMDMTERSADELSDMCEWLVLEAQTLRNTAGEDENGVFMLSADYNDCFDAVTDAYDKLGKANPILSRNVYPAKSVFMSDIMSSVGVTGLFMPFLAEANVNTAQPDLGIPFSAAHENAHYLGFAREDEANFIAFLVCFSASDPDIRYSGYVMTLMYSANALKNVSPEHYMRLCSTFSDDLKADIAAYNSYWAQYDGAAMELMNDINDGYLKFNEQTGVSSYTDMVDLMLAWYYSLDRSN